MRLSEAVTFDLLDDAVIPVTFMTFDPAKLRAWIAERKETLLASSREFQQPIPSKTNHNLKGEKKQTPSLASTGYHPGRILAEIKAGAACPVF